MSTSKLKCTSCEKEKPETDFNWKQTNISRQSKCRTCQSKYQKRYYETWEGKPKHRKRVQARTKQVKRKALTILNKYKASEGCSCCPEEEVCVLEFHHYRGDKQGNISDILGSSFQRVLEELEKCTMVCANCHRKIHAGLISEDDLKPVNTNEILKLYQEISNG